MTKKLNTDQIQNELEGSVFFSARPTPPHVAPSSGDPKESESASDSPATNEQESKQTSQRKHAHARMHASMHSRPHAGEHAEASEAKLTANGDDSELVERIRKTVRNTGRGQYSYVRVTEEEKAALADFLHAYGRRNTKSSETEVMRIGLGFLLADYEEKGNDSLLIKVLTALRS
jgi:hypothetical protein